ncbi:MAG: hypothetical protein HQL07_00280 [Nitrospirae bacterium]|nr:hypothetical protein [Magnetococcales bacterium]
MADSHTHMPRNNKDRSGQRAGSVLMITLVLIMVGGAMAAALARMMSDRTRTVTDNLAASQALYLAETGLERAAMRLRNYSDELVKPRQPGCWKNLDGPWDSGTITVRTGGIARGDYESRIDYDDNSGDWTLWGTGYVPSKAQQQGVRQVRRVVNKCQCIASFPPVYLNPEDQEIPYIGTSRVNNVNVPNTTSGRVIDECAQIYKQKPYFTENPVFRPFPDVGATPGPTTCPTLSLTSTTDYGTVTVPSNKSNCKITFAPAFPSSVNINTLQIDGKNATITMTPGHYYIRNLNITRATTKFVIDTSLPNPPYTNVNLHVQNMTFQSDDTIWLNGSNDPSGQNPKDFTLWLHNDGGVVPQELRWDSTIRMAGVVVVQENVIFRPAWNRTQILHGGILSWGGLVLDYNTELRIIYQNNDAKDAIFNVINDDIKPAGTDRISPPVRMEVGSWNEVR